MTIRLLEVATAMLRVYFNLRLGYGVRVAWNRRHHGFWPTDGAWLSGHCRRLVPVFDGLQERLFRRYGLI